MVRKQEQNTIESKKVLQHYQDWMDSFVDANGVKGTHVQTIIDTELAQIIKKKEANKDSEGQGEKLKIKYACINPAKNATHDEHLQSHLFLVVDYDADVQSVHNKKNGGVIESNGKKYLIVGTLGYGSTDPSNVSKEQLEINLARRDLYNNVFGAAKDNLGILQEGKIQYFKDHPSDRFRVLDDVTTEVVPGTLTPGYMVRQLEGEEAPVSRPISEILDSEERNPQGIRFRDLKFGIQEYTTFYSPKEPKSNVMVPRSVENNAGNTFVLIPASNGKWLPVAINAYRYTDLVARFEGQEKNSLYKNVEDNLNKLVSADHNVRLSGILGLQQVFHFHKDDTIIVSRKDGSVDFIKNENGKDRIEKVNLKDNPNALQDVMNAFTKINPRVNITPAILKDNTRLKELDEIGALSTDCALMHTVGARYSVYPVDSTGKMIVSPDMQVKVTSDVAENGYRNENERKIHYNLNTYRYNISTNTYTLDGKTEPVTDEATIRDLDYNREVFAERGLSASESKNGIDYFILDSGENPKVIGINRANKKVKELTTEESQKFIEELKKKEEAEKREAEARERNKKANTVDVDLDDGSLNVDTETGEIISAQPEEATTETPEPQKKEKKGEEMSVKPTKTTREDLLKGSLEAKTDTGNKEGTVDFKGLLKAHKSQKIDIIKAIAKKKGAPITLVDGIPSYKIDAVVDYLKSINMPVEGIGTSEADLKTWLDTLDKCR